MTLKEVLEGTLLKAHAGADIVSPESAHRVFFSGVSTDSRKIGSYELFVALKGPNFDGNDFIPEVFKKGARASICSMDWFKKSSRSFEKDWLLIPSKDPLLSLQELSLYHRGKFAIPVVAVTGTNGKTTTREMIAGALSSRKRVLKTEGNFNNHIGVPLTLLRLSPEHETAVLELGMSKRGEIRRLAELARPSVGVITNVGPAHLRDSGSIEEIVKGKSELGEFIESGGTLILNADFPGLIDENKKWDLQKVTFSLERPSQFRLKSLIEKNGGYEVEVEGGISFYLPLLGKGNVSNSLAALTVSTVMGIPVSEFAGAIASMRPLPGRMEICEVGGVKILNDTYNANPSSVSVALEIVREMRVGGKKMALLGDMLELGDASRQYHREIGARASFLDAIYAIGEFASAVRDGAVSEGMPQAGVKILGTTEEAASLLGSLLAGGDLLLIKGSRGMKLEEVFERLKGVLKENPAKVRE